MATLNEAVDQNSGGLPDRIAALSSNVEAPGADLLAQLTDLQNQQADLAEQEQNQPRGLDHLKSVPGIMSLLGIAGGAIAGDGDVAAAGAEGLVGTMERGNALSDKNAASLAQTRQMMSKALDKKRQQLATMITTRPELFIDAQTGESVVDPRLLGFASTGFVIPIDPGVNYRLKQKTERENVLASNGLELIFKGENEAQVKLGLNMFNKGTKLNLTQAQIEDLAQKDTVDQFLTLAANPRVMTSSALAAWKYTSEHPGADLNDPNVVGILTADMTVDSKGNKITLPDKQLQLIGELNTAIGQTPEAFAGLTWTEKIELAFGETRQADAQLLKKYFDVDDPFGAGVTAEQAFNAIANNTEIWANIYAVKPNSDMWQDLGINSAADIPVRGVELMQGSFAAMRQLNLDAAAKSRGMAQSRIAEKIKQDVEGVTSSKAAKVAAETVQDLIKEHSSSTGVLDGKAFQAAVDEWLNKPVTIKETP